jgi:ATP-dependent helicase/nuclease subunit B
MDLFSNIHANTTIVTPNRRLSATLFKQYNQYQLSKDRTCWERLDVLPLTNWIERLWHAYCAFTIEVTPLILTAQQEHVLWEEILSQSPANETLLQLSATAELAKSAWNILKQWRVKPASELFDLTDDSRAFQHWAGQFEQQCKDNHWLDTACLFDLVCEKIEKKSIPLPKQLILIGFTEYTPQQKYLFSLCESLDTNITYSCGSMAGKNQTLKRIRLTDEEAEINHMARWAKSLFQQRHPFSIGCVVPHLEKVRDHILYTFTHVFSLEKTLTLDPTTLPFNISAGKSLAAYPIIHAALQWLSLNVQTLSHEELTQLLHSPFIGDADNERIQRAYFDSHLRHMNMSVPSLNTLMQPDAKINLMKTCPQLGKRIDAYVRYFNEKEKTHSPSGWVPIFIELLTILGWPGERSVNSHEYQVIQRFLELLNEYALLDHILPSQTYQQALHYLKRLANKTIFQVQTPEAPIQILGLLEAAEIPFDYVWVMGLDDTTWPPAARPNPFIPHRLQKTLNMPHANAERELIYSMKLTEQLKQNSTYCIFSHAEKNLDCELRPSSLITSMDEITVKELTLSEVIFADQIIFHSRDLEYIKDDQAPSIMENEEIHGGVNIFKQQAACPFKAFSDIRLHARKLASFKIGLRPEERGTLVHNVLERIWQSLKNSDTLINMDPKELTDLIHQCSIEAIEHMTGKKIKSTRYLFLEVLRLETLMAGWLAIEKNRPAFKVISQEKKQTAIIGQIPLTLRVDRIDELMDGTQLIIDYKTGKDNQIKYWFSKRPDEPQLPLYCLIKPEQTVGIAFAQIHPDLLTFKGMSKRDINIPSIIPIVKVNDAENRHWEEQIEHWRALLDQLGNEFYQGKAEVNPKEDETCQYCDLQALCRIHDYDK